MLFVVEGDSGYGGVHTLSTERDEERGHGMHADLRRAQPGTVIVEVATPSCAPESVGEWSKREEKKEGGGSRGEGFAFSTTFREERRSRRVEELRGALTIFRSCIREKTSLGPPGLSRPPCLATNDAKLPSSVRIFSCL